MRIISMLVVTLLGFGLVGCTTTRKGGGGYDSQEQTATPATQSQDYFMAEDFTEREGVTVLRFKGKSKVSDPRVESLKKRYDAKELEMDTTLFIYPDGDEVWFQTTSSVGAYQSKTIWSVWVKPLAPLDMSQTDLNTEEGKRLVQQHNARALAVEQGRFVAKNYGMHTGEGWVPSILEFMGDVLSGAIIRSGGSKATATSNSYSVSNASATASMWNSDFPDRHHNIHMQFFFLPAKEEDLQPALA